MGRIHLLLAWAITARASQLNARIDEGMDQGHFILNIPQEMQLDAQPTGYTFKVVPSNDYLEIREGSDGIDLVAGSKPIDREAVCPTVFRPDSECIMMDYTILAIKGADVNSFQLRIEVLDVNDNDPIFPHSNFDIPLSENAAIGTIIRLESAADKDPDHGIKEYELRGYSNLFKLEKETNKDGTIIPSLILQDSLDREKKEQYQLELIAYDTGDKTAILNVTINVMDVNDNPPELVHLATVSVDVSESAEVGELVYQVNATDKDENPDLAYQFHSANNELVTQFFTIEKSTGRITVASKLDADKANNHNIYVTVSDGEHQISCTVSVNIVDTNDKKPEIIVTWIGPGEMRNNEASFDENLPSRTPLFHITVHDSDPGKSGTVETTIDNNDFFELENKETASYIVYTQQQFDRETREEFELTITAHDFGEPQLSSERVILIKINDVNDNPPKFLQPSYERRLSESDDKGTVVFELEDMVKDNDQGDNGRVSFTLLNDSDVFELVANQIVLARPIDADSKSTQNEYILKVEARDHGDVPKSSTADFKVIIMDINDNKPFFDRSTYNFTVIESKVQDEIGVVVGKVRADDEDHGAENNEVIYRINTPSDQLVDFPFELDSITGEIKTNRTLDRDRRQTNSKWNFLVTAENRVPLVVEHPNGASRAFVTISLIDENDNKPVLVSVKTRRDKLEGQAITDPLVVIHRDPDQNDLVVEAMSGVDGDVERGNKEIIYTLDGGSKELFRLDDGTGELKYVGEKGHNYGCHQLVVVVRNENKLIPDSASWNRQKINVYFARGTENVTDIEDLCHSGGLFGIEFANADVKLTLIAIFIGVALIIFVIIVILIIKCRWKAKKGAKPVKHHKSGQLLSSTTQDGTLDSRNDFEGDWTRPQHAMSPQYYHAANNNHHQPHHHRQQQYTNEAGNHSFTSKDSGTGDSVPTENQQFMASPEAQRFASDQHKLGYGDESWATNSMVRHLSQPQVRLGNLPQPHETDIPSPYHHQSPPSHEHVSPTPPPPVQHQQFGSYRRSHKPTFTTFVDNHSETSSMSAALINGHMSPDFDRIPSSANNTLERPRHMSNSYSDYGELGPSVIPEEHRH